MSLAAKKRGWPYHSHAEMAAAGYKSIGPGVCRYRLCRREVFWYETPRGKNFPIDPRTFEPHFATCLDRARFHRERKLRTRRRKADVIDFEIARRRREAPKQCQFTF